LVASFDPQTKNQVLFLLSLTGGVKRDKGANIFILFGTIIFKKLL